jgi:hypothetical protein
MRLKSNTRPTATKAHCHYGPRELKKAQWKSFLYKGPKIGPNHLETWQGLSEQLETIITGPLVRLLGEREAEVLFFFIFFIFYNFIPF